MTADSHASDGKVGGVRFPRGVRLRRSPFEAYQARGGETRMEGERQMDLAARVGLGACSPRITIQQEQIDIQIDLKVGLLIWGGVLSVGVSILPSRLSLVPP